VDKFVKISIIVAALMAGFGVFYHYVIHLPAIEREKRDAEEQEKADAALAEAARKSQYESCKGRAAQMYNAIGLEPARASQSQRRPTSKTA